jgi:hypothetical protein
MLQNTDGTNIPHSLPTKLPLLFQQDLLEIPISQNMSLSLSIS